MDFFAGSGTTGRVCIEENRHSIMVDADESLMGYLKKHIEKADISKSKPYEIIENPSIDDFLNMVGMSVNE